MGRYCVRLRSQGSLSEKVVARGQPWDVKGEEQEQKAVKQMQTGAQEAGTWQRKETVC